MLFCAPIIGLWYWCTDQYIVQRALGAPNETRGPPRHHLRGISEAAPVYLFIIPGMVCFALAKSGKVPELAAMVGPDGQRHPAAAQGAFPMLVQYLLPPGLRGMVVAGLLSALMGSLAGVFNACSTLFTVDLYQKWKPDATQHQLVRTGRMATAVMVAGRAGLDSGDQGRAGPLRLLAGGPRLSGAADFRGVFLRRILQAAERQGALWAMIVGFVLGIFRMLVDTPVTLGLPGIPERLRRRARSSGSSTTSTSNTSAC